MKSTMNPVMNHSRKKKVVCSYMQTGWFKAKKCHNVFTHWCAHKQSQLSHFHTTSFTKPHHIIPCIWVLVHCLRLFQVCHYSVWVRLAKANSNVNLKDYTNRGYKNKLSSISESILQFASNASDMMLSDQLILGHRNIPAMHFANTVSLI